MLRRRACFLALAIALGAFAAPAWADTTIRIVSPFAAGGVGDAIARILAEGMRTSLSATVIVENRTGASGRIGVQHVRDAPADGSVLLYTPIAPMAIYPHTYDRLDYDPDRDFAPVSQVATFEFGLAVANVVPATDLGSLVAWVKANPQKGVFGIPGEGTLPHFCGVLFARTAGIELEAIAYRGNAPALTELMGGHLPLFVTSSPDLVEAHRAGRIRVLATSGDRRAPSLPDVPTFRESGFAITGAGWYAVYAPVRTPPATVDRLSRAIGEIVRTPAARSRMAELGLTPTGTSGGELGDIQRRDSAMWGPIVRASRFKAQP